MNLKLALITLACTIIFLAETPCSFGQKAITESVKDKKITIKMNKVPLGKVFNVLIRDYDISIGFEESKLDRHHNDYDFEALLPGRTDYEKSKQDNIAVNNQGLITIVIEQDFNVEENWISINAEDTRLEDVLNEVVEQMKHYKWEINDNVVNIYPKEGRDQRYAELLNLKIKNYYLPKDIRLGWVRNKIFDLPEVENFLQKNNIYFSSFRLDGDYTSKPLTVELSFSNLSFRELLNSIAKSKGGGWILRSEKPHKIKDKEYINVLI